MSDGAIYKKFKNGCEFLRLKNGQLVSVMIVRGGHRIMETTNKNFIDDFNNELLTMDCTPNEFKKAMSTANYEITKND